VGESVDFRVPSVVRVGDSPDVGEVSDAVPVADGDPVVPPSPAKHPASGRADTAAAARNARRPGVGDSSPDTLDVARAAG
jgi:hypothetical protein